MQGFQAFSEITARIEQSVRFSSLKLIPVILLFYVFPCFAQSGDFTGRIDIMLMKENYKQVIALLDSVLAEDPGNSEAHYKIALAFQNIYKYDKAIDHLEKAKLLSPDEIRIYSALGRNYFSLGDNDKAIKAYEEALQKDSMNLNNSFNLARVLVDDQQFDEAADIYHRLLSGDSTNSYIFKQLGYCALKGDRIAMSAYYYLKAYLLNPGDLNVALQLGINYIKLDRLALADSVVNKYMKLYPEDIRFCRLKGEIFFKKKDFKGADSCFSRVLEEGDSSAYVFQKLGFSNYIYATNNDSLNANQKLKYFDKAARALAYAVKQDSLNPVLYEYLGLSYNKSGRFQEGLDAMLKAKKYSISDIAPDICVYTAKFHRDLKQFKEAIEAYKDALHFRPDDESLNIIIAGLYKVELKDKKSAAPYYIKFYEMKLRNTPELDKRARNFMEAELKRLKDEISAKDSPDSSEEMTGD